MEGGVNPLHVLRNGSLSEEQAETIPDHGSGLSLGMREPRESDIWHMTCKRTSAPAKAPPLKAEIVSGAASEAMGYAQPDSPDD